MSLCQIHQRSGRCLRADCAREQIALVEGDMFEAVDDAEGEWMGEISSTE
jgi:hypothetical protein